MKYKSIWFLFFLILLLPLPSLSASLVVDSLSDESDSSPGDGTCVASSGCTLRAAIQEANALGETSTITFGIDGTFTLNIKGTDEDEAVDGDLDIKSNLTLQGNGTSSTIITQSTGERIFHIPSSGLAVTFQNLRITGGFSGDEGAGIFNEGAANLTITDSQIDENESEDNGGGLFSEGGALVISGSTISDNEAEGYGGIGAESGTVAISSSIISGNTSSEGGGGLGVVLATSVTISESSISSNFAPIGGGIFAVLTTSITISNSTIASNWSVWGGGILSFVSAWNISGTTFSSNTAGTNPSGESDCSDGTDNDGDGLVDSDDDDCYYGNGGAIGEISEMSGTDLSSYGANSFAITNSTFSGNSAGRNGAGIYLPVNSTTTLNNVTLTNNSATESGGGIYVGGDAVITLRNTLLADNISSTDTTEDCYGALSSDGYNLIGDSAGCTFSALDTDQVGDSTGSGVIDAKLLDLASNGGSTQTHALSSDSPALDAGNSAVGCTDGSAVLTTDQLGAERTQDGNGDGTAVCDIGAYEYAAVTASSDDTEEEEEEGEEEDEVASNETTTEENTTSIASVITGMLSGGACEMSLTRAPIHSPLGLVFVLGNITLFCVLRRRVKARMRAHTGTRSKWESKWEDLPLI